MQLYGFGNIIVGIKELLKDGVIELLKFATSYVKRTPQLSCMFLILSVLHASFRLSAFFATRSGGRNEISEPYILVKSKLVVRCYGLHALGIGRFLTRLLDHGTVSILFLSGWL